MIWLWISALLWAFSGGIAWGLVVGEDRKQYGIDGTDFAALPCAFLLGPLLLAVVIDVTR